MSLRIAICVQNKAYAERQKNIGTRIIEIN